MRARGSPLAAAAIVAVVLGGASCSPYDPSLPPAPFLCADREPRCPDGYVCRSESDGREVCRAADAVIDAAVPDGPALAPSLAPPRTP